MNANKESQRKRLKRNVNNNNNNSKNRMILRSDVKDRISQLPDHLLHYILAFLTTKEAARMSVLSKTWCRVRDSYPHLVFNKELFLQCEKSEFSKKRDKFMNIVNDTLLKFCKQKVSMETFMLFTTLYDVEHSTRVDHWMKLAIENYVKEIHLCFRLTREQDIRYILPQTVFAARTLTVLKLWNCRFKYPLFGDTTKSQSLKELSLENIHADENIIQNFIVSCPLIENLAVVWCRRVKLLRLSGFDKLKKVELHEDDNDRFDSIEIVEMPSLQALHYNGSSMACKIDETSLKNLEVLELNILNGVTDQQFEFLISRCTLLKTLMISGGLNLKRIKISSHRLQHLKLFYLYNLMVLDIDTPNLHSFEFAGDISQVLFSMDTSSIRKATLNIFRHYCDAFLFSRLREYLGKLSQDTDFTLRFVCQKVSFSPTILRGTSVPVLCDFKHLKLTVDSVFDPVATEKDYEDLVDGLFWCFHPQTISFIGGWKGSNEFLKVLCENLVKRRQKKSCCSPSDIKCWRHYLKKVRIESFTIWQTEKKVSSCRSLLKSLALLPPPDEPLGPLLLPYEKIIFKLTW